MSQTISKSEAENEVARGGDGALRADDVDGLEAAYRGFSCPCEPFDESFAQLIAGEYARSVLSVFTDQFGDMLAQSGSGLDPLFSRLLDADLPFALSWSSELGNLYGVARRRDQERARRDAAAFALMAGAQGFSGEWGLRLPNPAALFWDDWELPESDEVRVAADGPRASVNLSLSGE